MQVLADVARIETILFGAALAAIVLFQLLGRRMNMYGLLLDKVTEQVSPGRIQLLVVTMLGAGILIGALMQAMRTGSGVLELPTGSSPLAVLIASHGIYLFGKYRSQIGTQ